MQSQILARLRVRGPFLPALATVAFIAHPVPSSRADVLFRELHTASDHVLVAVFQSTNYSGPVWNTVYQTDEVDVSRPKQWTLNGRAVGGLNRFVTEADGVDYHIYLEVPRLLNGNAYSLNTPYGTTNFIFDERRFLCESIKVNQSGYSPLSHARSALMAIWLGDGGPRKIDGPLPSYNVLNASGKPVARGTLQALGPDSSSGDFVYRLDLAQVPEGGPFRVCVPGYGCSYPFGVGGEFSRRLAYTAFRSLYYQRCGCAIVAPFAQADIRPEPCHTVVYDSQSPGIEHVKLNGSEPRLAVHGGYHDAGDSDRNAYHLLVPLVLMTTYEAFPSLFADGQFNIPDRFDAQFKPLGSGNGIPDILDEVDWGTMLWTNLQSTPAEGPGAVAWGDNAPGNANPAWGINWDEDRLRYGTEKGDVISCGLAAGVFMNLARLLQPFAPERGAEYQARAEAAVQYCQSMGWQMKSTHQLYYAIQKYLLTGDAESSNLVSRLALETDALKSSYHKEAGGFVTDGHIWLPNFFMSYLLATNRPRNPVVVECFKRNLKAAADDALHRVQNAAYPSGWATNENPAAFNFQQGAFTAQGQFAYPCLMQWALTKEQKYIDAAGQLMDYVQGLNPLGKCYMTGLGSDPVHHPHQRESSYAQQRGWGGPQPGIVVYGPVVSGDAVTGARQVPGLSGLARERRYVDHLGFYQMNEFTVYQSEVFPAAVYPVLAGGGKWNRLDPFTPH